MDGLPHGQYGGPRDAGNGRRGNPENCGGPVCRDAWQRAKKEGGQIPSSYYFDIYTLRFFPNPRNGYSYLEKIMERCDPSLGYHTLAKLLTEGNLNNLVITTNFDSLVEDALFLYTENPLWPRCTVG